METSLAPPTDPFLSERLRLDECKFSRGPDTLVIKSPGGHVVPHAFPYHSSVSKIPTKGGELCVICNMYAINWPPHIAVFVPISVSGNKITGYWRQLERKSGECIHTQKMVATHAARSEIWTTEIHDDSEYFVHSRSCILDGKQTTVSIAYNDTCMYVGRNTDDLDPVSFVGRLLQTVHVRDDQAEMLYSNATKKRALSDK